MRTDYCKDFTTYGRYQTWEIDIGGTALGNSHPIRIQSMTNTDTNDAHATVEQIIKIVREGADYVRITIPNKKAAEKLQEIKEGLKNAHVFVPLIADIHFNPELAFMAASLVEKVRINPGNYNYRKGKNGREYDPEQYGEELEIVKVQYTELLKVCKKHNTALRIGTNHGSLSDRIMNRYGDTPEGMAESVMEFLRICIKENFKQVVVSIKASNTRIMVYATRLLVCKMQNEDMYFPIHLGVTEAGEGEDGRIKSAVGMGALLSDGIGDTIRVSLTEDPELEIPVARKITDYISQRFHHKPIEGFDVYPIHPFEYEKFHTESVKNLGGKNLPVVIHSIQGEVNIKRLKETGWIYSKETGWSFTDLAPDYLYLENWPASISFPKEKHIIFPLKKIDSRIWDEACCLMTFREYVAEGKAVDALKFVLINASEINTKSIDQVIHDKNLILVVDSNNKNSLADQRAATFRLMNRNCLVPLIFRRQYRETSTEDFQLKSALDLGGLFIDGLGDGIWLENDGNIPDHIIVSASFGILQASRVRITKTEYISCPSCGRTLFDIQATTQKIREKTSHLKGLKIGIMGCMVNGPGEMADADYGYVGAGKERVTLYKEKTVIKKNVPEENAVRELIKLIKENGDWVDP